MGVLIVIITLIAVIIILSISLFSSKPNIKVCENDYKKCLEKNPDIDKDGWTNEEEFTRGTDPSNPNTDYDRYKDPDDPQPLILNTAHIKLSKINEKSGYNTQNMIRIGGAILGIAPCILNVGACLTVPKIIEIVENAGLTQVMVYDYSFDAEITNDGDDYTSLVHYNIAYIIDGERKFTEFRQIGRVNAGEKIIEPHHYGISAGDAITFLVDIFKEILPNIVADVFNREKSIKEALNEVGQTFDIPISVEFTIITYEKYEEVKNG